MAQLNIDVPSVKASFYDSISAKANKEKVVNVIRPNFGKYINNSSAMSNVPSELIESFIFIESGGNPKAESPYAVGLMQVGDATASDCLVKEKGAGRLSAEENAIIKKYLGERYSLIDSVKPKQTTLGKTFITKEDLFKPEFNIFVGTILLKQLMDEFTEPNGKIRMDKVVAIYNGGRYGKLAKKIIAYTGTIEELIKQVPKETSSYIVKLLGNDGLLDSMV
jgi:soluble lytic murein transglycosylase-like protein